MVGVEHILGRGIIESGERVIVTGIRWAMTETPRLAAEYGIRHLF